MAEVEKLNTTVQAAATVILAAATLFTGFVAVNTWGLSEDYGRLDTKIEAIQEQMEKQTVLMGDIDAKLDANFNKLVDGMDEINLRLGHLETGPEVILTAGKVSVPDDIKAIFYSGSLYYMPRTPDAVVRLEKAGFKLEMIEGIMPGFLIQKEPFKPESWQDLTGRPKAKD